MKASVIRRKDIIAILEAWQAGRMSGKDVHRWADAHYFPGRTEFDDWEKDSSAANEVMAVLDMLDIDCGPIQQIAHHLEFLRTPQGKFAEAYARWQTGMSNSTTTGGTVRR